MATIVGSAIGASVGGPIGAQIGGAIGGYIDQNFVFPALFPPDPIEGPRIGELRVNQSQEGGPLRRCLGAENRVGASAIWLAPLREVANTEEVGGKGGPGVDQTTYTYFTDVAVALTEGPPDGLGIVEMSKLLANGKVIYEANPNRDVTSTQLFATDGSVGGISLGTDPVTGEPLPSVFVDFYLITIASPIGGPDLSEFRSGYDVTVSGFTVGTQNNGTYRCINSVLQDDGASFIVLRRGSPGIPGVDDPNVAGDPITLFQALPQFDPDLMTSVTVYNGTDSQLPDSLIQATEGAAPGYRGLAYVVIEGLNLTEFGNRLPEWESILWATGTTDYLGMDPENVGGALSKLLAWAQQDPSRFADLSSITFDTTDVDDIPLRGYTITGARTLRGQIQPLLLAYDIFAQEENGRITFRKRANTPEVAVDPDDLAAHPFNSDTDRTIQVTDRAGQNLAKAVEVTYVDAVKRYQQGTQKARRVGAAPTASIIRTELPVVLSGDEARAAAERVLWTQYANAKRVRLQLPPSYFRIQEGDVLTWTDPDLTSARAWRVVVQSIERGANGLLVVEGAEEVAATTSWTVPSDDPKAVSTNDSPRLPGDLLLRVVDVAALRSEDARQPGLYVAISRTSTAQAWPGSVLYESFDDMTFAPQQRVTPEALQGQATNALGTTAYPAEWDRANSVNIRLPLGLSLSSQDEDAVLAGANRAYLGQEIIGFATATLESDGTYTLTDLLRGIQGTEAAVDTHIADEPFVFLDPQRLRFVSLSTADLDVLRYYKAAPIGASPTNYVSREVTPILGTLRPLAPTSLAGVQDGSDWDLTWERRSRDLIDAIRFEPAELPTIEPAEAYEIEVRNVATGDPVATYTSATPSFTYTSAQQTTDFGAPQASIRVAIYQISSTIGRGWPVEETFS